MPAIAEAEKPGPSRAATDLTVLGKSTETVQVETSASAAAPAPAASTLDNELSADKHEAIGKLNRPSAQWPAWWDRNPSKCRRTRPRARKETVGQKMDRSKLRRSLVSRWTISADGQLQHSIDAGQTWQPVTVAERRVFRRSLPTGPTSG